MDEKYLELAGALAEGESQAGVAACAKKAIPEQDLEPHQYKRRTCANEDCEDDLPEFRMKKGLEYCVDCQSIKERAKRR